MIGKLVKKDGKIWFVEQLDIYGNHTRSTLMGFYDEEEEKPVEDKPKKKKNIKKEIDE